MVVNDECIDVCAQFGYAKVCAIKVLDDITIEKFKCIETGLTVVLAQVEGPIVDGLMCIPTEAHDDDGLPHTLEHLVFLGSEEYPYKGILDLLSNRCLSSGTNAWTDTDHTAYTMTTAGAEGFLNLLPIYLDHVVFPLLKDSAFTTEVHHITGEGEDAGVVYCEMQGRENTGESRVNLELLRAIYPGHCGYKSETGGLLLNLRTSTTNEKVRAFHNNYYRPENLQIIVTGQVDVEQLLKAIKPFQDKLLKRRASKWSSGFERPWQLPVPSLKEDFTKVLEYGCDNEDAGLVFIGWRGPSAVSQIYKLLALTLLMEYLTDSSVSLLQQEFVEIDDPYCSLVAYSCIENSVSCIYLMFVNCPMDKVKAIPPQLTKALKVLADGSKAWDPDRMASVIHRRELEILENVENKPRPYIAFQIISDCLYGSTVQDLRQRLSPLEDIDKLKKETSDFWLNLLTEYLIEQPSATIMGVPSKTEMELMMGNEKKRVEERKKTLGPKKLKTLAEELEAAVKENNRDPPPELLECLNIPDPSKITFHPHTPYCNYEFRSHISSSHPQFSLDKLPFRMQLDDINSRFVKLSAILSVGHIDASLRLYLPLLVEALLESPIERDCVLVPYEDVVTQLNADSLESDVSIGLNGGSFTAGLCAETVILTLLVEPSKYERGVTWIKEILYQTKMTAERLKVIATKMINTVAQTRRNGHKMSQILLKELIYRKDTNARVVNPLRQHKFLTKVVAELGSEEESKEVIKKMEMLRKEVTQPKNLTIHMAAKVTALKDPINIWNNEFPSNDTPQPPKYITDKMCLVESLDMPKHYITGLGSVETSFVIQAVPSISDYYDADLPALMVLVQYLTQLESVMWKQIRGMGYSYDVWMLVNTNDGLLYFVLFKCTNPIAAVKEARSIFKACRDSKRWDAQMLDAAKSSLIFTIINREKDIGDVVKQSMMTYFKGTEHSYNRDFLSKVSGVTMDDLNRVCEKYLCKLLNPDDCRTAVVCYTSKVEEIKTGFKEFGVELNVIENLNESFMME